MDNGFRGGYPNNLFLRSAGERPSLPYFSDFYPRSSPAGAFRQSFVRVPAEGYLVCFYAILFVIDLRPHRFPRHMHHPYLSSEGTLSSKGTLSSDRTVEQSLQDLHAQWGSGL